MTSGHTAGVVTGQRPPPAGLPNPAPSHLSWSGYFGLRVDAAVNLLESRDYAGLDHPARLQRALGEQQRFIASLLGYADRACFDIRIIRRPELPTLRIAILGRTWSASQPEAMVAAADIRQQLLAAAPRHLTLSAVTDPDELHFFLAPFGRDQVNAGLVTKRELIGIPSRMDAGVPYYFSVAPLSWVEADWNPLYASMSASADPLCVSVGLFPGSVPSAMQRRFAELTTFYGRLAREDVRHGGTYYGTQKLPPDAFAVQAEPVFRDYLQRCGDRAFTIRVQVTAPTTPTGALEAVAAAIAPPNARTGSHLDMQRAGATVETRLLTGPQGSQIAAWNLTALDAVRSYGRPEIWGRPDRPQDDLAYLATLGDAVDASCAVRLPIAVDGTVPGFPVRRGQFGQMDGYEVSAGAALTIGTFTDNGAALRLPIGALTKHALIAGAPGSGKTTTVLELLRQLWVDHRRPFLVIEPVNSDADDYRRLRLVPGLEGMRVLTLGDEDIAPLRFNPFEVPVGVLVSEHIANLLACFKAAFGLWEPLPGIYQDALNSTYLTAGILSSERIAAGPRRWPTVVEFLDAMTEATKDLGYAGEVKSNIEAASLRRAQQLTSGPTASTFLTDQSLDIERLLSEPTVLELKSLGTGDEQALMMALLLNAMTEHYQAHRGSTPSLAHVTVIEEAHRLLTRPSGGGRAEDARAKEQAAESFANTLAENRKYGEGVIIAEQVPTKLVADAVKNTNLKLMHRLTSEEDREYLGESMGLDESQKRFATRLVTGEALAYSDEYPEAAHVTVRPVVPFGRPPVIPREAAPPFAACAPCRAKCSYRGASMAILRQQTVRAQLTATRRVLADPGLDAAQSAAAWSELNGLLRTTVSGFPALPSVEPALSDAAYCLFLHSLGVDTMNYSPQWPAAVARRLDITPVEGR